MKYLLVANWKMGPKSLREAQKLYGVSVHAAQSAASRVEMVVCPPFPYLGALSFPAPSTARVKVALGAQDIFSETEGAFTGAVSPAMLKSVGVSHVIVGHSERRAMGETNKEVSKKSCTAIKGCITPIICVGEATRDDHGAYFSFLETELKESLAGISRTDAKKIIIAYEPIWAIGARATGADTPDGTREATLFLRKVLVGMFGHRTAFTVPILYGGSVNKKNAAAFLTHAGIQGLLVGRASTNTSEWSAIVALARIARKNL